MPTSTTMEEALARSGNLLWQFEEDEALGAHWQAVLPLTLCTCLHAL